MPEYISRQHRPLRPAPCDGAQLQTALLGQPPGLGRSRHPASDHRRYRRLPSSRTGENGIGTSIAPIRCTGASR